MRSKINPDFAGASAPDSSLNDSQFAAHVWDSKVSLLSLLKMKTNAETSERDWKLAAALELKKM